MSVKYEGTVAAIMADYENEMLLESTVETNSCKKEGSRVWFATLMKPKPHAPGVVEIREYTWYNQLNQGELVIRTLRDDVAHAALEVLKVQEKEKEKEER